MKSPVLCMFSVLGGMVLGSALALALTPKTGSELRKAMHDFVNEEIAHWHSCHCQSGQSNDGAKAEVK